ncbi:hypothetical protein Moror_4086 [Moniliophthora roreri MCA 2997]|uniref:NADH dehydrogenase [ubiquinone] 1 alpha subcomplex subunit n=1 Tax=Moniliophthora roreri (strain MCA 2997) TaxID=1381753 RepID=V2WV63_MONRO|nr:hypothetical protein Moror_4086 [Moniliophthora roreri MCA 2997]
MSFFRRLWRVIRSPTGFVGRDLEGNSFYERPSPFPDGRTRRSVKYRRQEDQWLYIGGQRRLPIQWSAWLSHTRVNPPTMQELQIDLFRQQRVQQNALRIQAADELEREEQIRLLKEGDSTSKPKEVSTPPTEGTPAESSSPSATSREAAAAPASKEGKPLPQTGPDEFKPEPWAPKASVRGGA